uniref:Uncharacterized protein n=1 Tax=Phlebotomus papatasi TaxID=29031 RepID=A0A1B0DG99_PHLPP
MESRILFATILVLVVATTTSQGVDDGKYRPSQQVKKGQYVHVEDGKYVDNAAKWRYVHVHDQREKGKYIHVHIPYDGGYGPYSHIDNPYKHIDNPYEGLRSQGFYQYTGDDGQVYRVDYVADNAGFVPRGDHIPKMPPEIEKLLAYLAANAPAS